MITLVSRISQYLYLRYLQERFNSATYFGDLICSFQNHFDIENEAPTITKVAVIPSSITNLGQCWRSGVLSKLLHHQGTLARKHKLSYGNDLDH